MEEAGAYRALIGEFGLTHEDIARRVGRAKSTITNTLRLLDLEPRVQAALVDGHISEGHARAIGGLPIEQQPRVATSVVEQGLSVRQTEELVRRLREPRPAPAEASDASPGSGPRARRGRTASPPRARR